MNKKTEEVYDDPMTVGKLLDILAKIRKDAKVNAYEGEGGSWILVRDPEDIHGLNTIVQIHTD